MIKVAAVFSVTMTMSLSIYLFSYDIFNIAHVAWIHYIVPFSVGVIFAASSIMIYVENS